jgi:hypothetical protein
MHPGGVELQHLARGVDGDQLRGIASQLLGPDPGTAGQLENLAGRPERRQRRSHFGCFSEPLPIQRSSPVLAPLPEPPLLVFGGPGAIVLELLLEHDRGITRGRR